MDLAAFIESQRSRVCSTERRQENQQMLAKYGPLFHPDNIPNLSEDAFKSFLRFKENKHWMSIHRHGGILTGDMDRLRQALAILVDDKRPIQDRLDELFPKGQPNYIAGLGRAVATPILTVVYPDRYGVYNTVSEQALEHFGQLPSFGPRASFAERYVAVNEVLKRLAKAHDLSLLELDNAFGWLEPGDDDGPEGNGAEIPEETIEALRVTVLERVLSDFLVDNWDKTAVGQWYELYEKDGEVAQEYRTPVGRIDLLAKDRKSGDWVVIELKQGRTSDAVVGQVLRYMGWVEEHMTDARGRVRAVITAGETSERLHYALKAVGDKVTLLTYALQFNVKQEPL